MRSSLNYVLRRHFEVLRMPKTVGSPVAIIPRLDTGVIRSSEGELDGHECEVQSDRSKGLLKYENVDLVSEEMGGGHSRFSGDELDTDLKEFIGKKFPHLTILATFWENRAKKQRIANFKFLLKPNEKSREGDPFYVHVINGYAIVRVIGKRA